MNDMPHSSAYANDPAYDNLTGVPVHISTVRGITRDGWVVDNTMIYIDIGRAAPTDVADPDAMIEAEDVGLFNDQSSPLAAAWESTKQRKRDRDAVIAQALRDAFAERGPMTSTQAAHALNLGRYLVTGILKANARLFCCVAGRKWGLIGVHDGDSRQ